VSLLSYPPDASLPHTPTAAVQTPMSIDTARLRLIPCSPEHLLALIEGNERFEERFGLRAADGLRAFFVSDDVSPAWLAALRASSAADPWTHGFAVVHREIRSVIGIVGFKGPPGEAGVVEIAYGIVPAFQGRGYATEAAAAGVAFAFADARVRLVRAHTLPTRNASTRVLAKCGFAHVGQVEDPEDGLVWRWECGEGSP
jgi:ribosomal-protein-alanine N-acetyltransferase